MPIRAADLDYIKDKSFRQLYAGMYCRLHVDFPVGCHITLKVHISQVDREVLCRSVNEYVTTSIIYYDDKFIYSYEVTELDEDILYLKKRTEVYRSTSYFMRDFMRDYIRSESTALTVDEFIDWATRRTAQLHNKQN